MAALRLKEAVQSCEQARAALLRLPVLSTSSSCVSLSKPCIPPPLGPRPSETPNHPPPPAYNCRPVRPIRLSRHQQHETRQNELTHSHDLSKPQRTSGLSFSVIRENFWFGMSSLQGERTSDKEHMNSVYSQTLLHQLYHNNLAATSNLVHPSPTLNELFKNLYSLDENKWLALQQPAHWDSLERAQETPRTSQEVPRPQEVGHRAPEQRQMPSDKPTPSQMSFILLKLREEVSFSVCPRRQDS